MIQTADTPILQRRLVQVLSAGVLLTAVGVASLEWMTANLAASHPEVAIEPVAVRPVERAPRSAPAVLAVDSTVESFQQGHSQLVRAIRP